MADAPGGRVVSVNAGRVRIVEWQGRTLRTGIFKEPVAGRVAVHTDRVDGDEQADLAVHGGAEKAVYAYPHEHYAFWRAQGIAVDLPTGAFGENLTVEGFLEDEVCIGDRFVAGTAELIVRRPRTPCVKLCARLGREDMIRRFVDSERSGFYLSVVREGTVAAGDPFRLVSRDEAGVTLLEAFRSYNSGASEPHRWRRVLTARALPSDWGGRLRKRLEESER